MSSERLGQLQQSVRLLSDKLGRLSSLAAAHLAASNADTRHADHGDTMYMVFCTVLVMMMTIPGLGLYYAGMVRASNVVVTVMQSFSIACIVTLLWMLWGYSLVFGPSGEPSADGRVAHSSGFLGDGSRLWLIGMDLDSYHSLADTIPESVFCMYELAFAIITASLISGSFADRCPNALPSSRRSPCAE